MDPEIATASASSPITFRDGLGQRRQAAGAANQPLDVLILHEELSAAPAFEPSLRARVQTLAGFEHPAFARVRGVGRLTKGPARLVLASDHVTGVRLCELLRVAEQQLIPLEFDAALYLIRQLVPTIAALHQHAPGASHGALSPERIVITPDARVVIVEHVLGGALEGLRLSRERYWKDLRIATTPDDEVPQLDQRADVAQMGAIALALILGRQLGDDEYPGRIADIVEGVRAISPRGLEPLAASAHTWLCRALQLDAGHSFPSAIDALADEDIVPEVGQDRAREAFASFLGRYETAVAPCEDEAVASRATPFAAVAAKPALPARPAESTPKLEDTAAPEHVHVHVAAPESTWIPAPAPDPDDYPVPVPEPTYVPTASAARIDVAPPPVRPQIPATRAETTPPEASKRVNGAAHVDEALPAFMTGPRPTPESVEPKPHDRAHVVFENERRTPETLMPQPAGSRRRARVAVAATVLIALASGGTLIARRYFVPVATGTLAVTTNRPGLSVIVDGEARGATPLTIDLAAGSHVLEIHADGQVRSVPVTIAAGTQVAQFVELSAAAAVTGQLQIRTEPAGAAVVVDGVSRGVSPLTIDGLAPGTHMVTLGSGAGAVKEEVAIAAGATMSLVVPLAAPAGVPVSGWISIAAPVDVQVYEQQRLLGSSRSDRIMVAAGRHDLEIVNEALGYLATRTVQVTPGNLSAIQLDWPKGSLALNALPWAEVWVDGQRKGETPMGNVSVPIGPHEVIFRHPELGEQRHTVTVAMTGPARVSADMRKE